MPDSVSTITVLKQTIVKERLLDSLASLSDDFYQKLHVELNELDGRNIEQLQLLLNDLFLIRHSKIIQFASVMKLSNSIREKLSVEEIKFYEEIQKSSINLKDSVLTGNANYD